MIFLNCFFIFDTFNCQGEKYRILKRHQILNNLIKSDIKSFQSKSKYSCLKECNIMNEYCMSVSVFHVKSNIVQCTLFSEENSSLIDLNAYVYNEFSNVYLKKSASKALIPLFFNK